MSDESSPIPGTSVQALSGTNFRSIIKESLLEVLRENPEVLQPTTTNVQHQIGTTDGEGGKSTLIFPSVCAGLLVHLSAHRT